LARKERTVKKVINDVERVVDESLDGMSAAFAPWVRRIPGTNVLARAVPKAAGLVGVVSGGGSGHEPAHGGYVGQGMLDAAVAGEVFTSPTPDQILEGIRAANHGAGVLCVVKNYTGDIMNFEIAAELAGEEGIEVRQVVVNDDVAVEDSLYTSGRRGIAGTVFVHKIVGAAAERGRNLAAVEEIAHGVIANVRSMGLALAPCTVPARGEPTFELAEDEIEVGIGIHGEPGVRREPLRRADALTDELVDRVSTDLGLARGERLAVMVNSMGATPMIELGIVARRVYEIARERGWHVEASWVGEYMTSLEMAGYSVTLLRLDDERASLLAAPANTPAVRVCS